MPAKGQSLSGLCYVAWDTQQNTGKTGDAGNHSLRLIRDGVESIPSNPPAEVDPSGCPGLYKLNLTATEMNAVILTLAGVSSTANISIIPVQLTTSFVSSLITASGSPTAIWTALQLNQWFVDAIGQINVDVNCIYARECIAVTKNVSVVTLPPYVRTLRRVTWRGRTLTPVSWEELTLLSPATVFMAPGSSANIETSDSRPLYYAMHPTNPYDIRLYPSPSESFTVTGEPNPYAPQVNTPSCIIDHWREPDVNNFNPVLSLPSYVARRTAKCYVLFKAFGAEGKGQDLGASRYWKQKYELQIDYFKKINEGVFVSKRYALDENIIDPQVGRYPRPSLNPNYERIIF